MTSAGPAWREVSFLDVLEDATRGHTKTKQGDYLASGDLPVVDQGKDLIGGYTNDQAAKSHVPLPVIVFGDHTRCVKYIDFNFGPGADGVKILRARDGVDPRFAFHAVRMLDVPASGYSRHFKFLKESSLALPPIEEQRRIAAVLDAAEALRAKRRQAIAKLDSLFQAVFIDMFGDPLQPASDLKVAQLGEVARFARGITFKPSDVHAMAGEGLVAVMRTANVQTELDTSDVWYVPETFIRRDDQYLQPFDTLISSANSWNLVGRCCLIPEELGSATFGGFVTVLRPDHPGLRPRFLNAWFSSSKLQQTVRTFGRKTTNISNLDLKRCARLPIAVPPVDLQHEFEARVDAVMDAAARTESSMASLDALFASLQQRAFRGEL